jgi:hypothetical protein
MGHRTGAMQDAGYGLPRISILGTSVNKGMKKEGRGLREAPTLLVLTQDGPTHSVIPGSDGSSKQASIKSTLC